MDFLNATDPATLTASPQRVFKSRCYFCSSTNSCADHLPTAASTAVRTLNIAQTADSKPPTTAPTTPSRTSSICSPLRDGATSLLESSCLTSRRLESSQPHTTCKPSVLQCDFRFGSRAAVAGRRMAQPVYPQLRKYPCVRALTLRANAKNATLR